MISIFTLSPIILGISDEAAWSLPWILLTNEPMVFLTIIGVLFVAAIRLGFIPIIGQIQSLPMVILGGLCLAASLRLLDDVFPNMNVNLIDPIPSFSCLVGFLIIAGLVSRLGGMAVASIAVVLEGKAHSPFPEYAIIPLASVSAFIPVFVYGAWLGNQL